MVTRNLNAVIIQIRMKVVVRLLYWKRSDRLFKSLTHISALKRSLQKNKLWTCMFLLCIHCLWYFDYLHVPKSYWLIKRNNRKYFSIETKLNSPGLHYKLKFYMLRNCNPLNFIAQGRSFSKHLLIDFRSVECL